MNTRPLVSICMITYGHEKFIKQSVESILEQKISFDFELVIANDCSPDATDEEMKSLLATHVKSDKIRYFSHSENKGMHANFLYALNQCHGKYIALCEGDDYWTDTLKLQRQIDFLEGNPEYEICFNNISIVNEKGDTIKKALITDNRKTTYNRKDLPIWAPTLTRVFKNRDFTAIPSAPGLDTVMLLWQSQFGPIKFINEITGAYREHDGGIYSAQTQVKKKEHTLQTHLVGLSLIGTPLQSKYFGMLFKKLTELWFLDQEVFEKNKLKIKEAYLTQKQTMSPILRLKVRFSLIVLSLTKIPQYAKTEKILLKIFNRIFIYSQVLILLMMEVLEITGF